MGCIVSKLVLDFYIFVIFTRPLRFKVWLAESCRNHDAGIKTQALNLAKLFVKTGDKLSAKL